MTQQWVYTTQNDVSATPSVDVASNAVYFPDWAGNLNKLNASTGAVIWTQTMTGYGLPAGAISRGTPTLSDNMVIFGASGTLGEPTYGSGAYLLAVDAGTGNLIWKTEVDSTSFAIVSASPMVNNGIIYVGISSAQEKVIAPTFRGSLVAVSETSGQILWQTYMVPPGYTGGPIWSSAPAVDISRNQIYVTTGNNYTVPTSVQQCEVAAGQNEYAVSACQAPNNFEDSIVALDLTTGAIKWGTKCSYTDAWVGACNFGGNGCPTPKGNDFDFGSGANLFTANVNGSATDLVGAGQKSGVYWALNPTTGAVVWKQQVGPGGIVGGIQWGTATDSQRIYVAISNSRRTPYILMPSGGSWNGGSWAALDAATGQFIWQVRDPGMDPIAIGLPALALGPVTIANGVLYCADTAGLMFALDASSGATLWTFQAAGSVNAAPAIVNGVLFWGSGYHNFPSNNPIGTASNRFYSFSLPPAPAVTTTNLSSSLNPSSFGQSVTLSAAVTPVTATGTVTFLNGSTPIGTGVLANGAATLALSSLPIGPQSLTAAYGGDNNDAASTSAVLTQSVTPLVNVTATVLAATPNPSMAGQTVALTAFVSPASATGTVTFSDGGNALGTVVVAQGSATWQAAFPAGTHLLTASYSGDSGDAPSVSSVLAQIVNPLTAPLVVLTISPTQAAYGQSVALTAIISPTSATGEVTFYNGTTVLGSQPLLNGQAALTTLMLPAGVLSLRAYYGGDTSDLPSTSATVAATVNAVSAGLFQAAVNQSAGQNPLSIASGDFNGDGKLDFVVTTLTTGISIILGNGDGTFQAPVSYTLTTPTSVAVGDFNGDGKTDIAAANGSQGVAVLLGNGDGTFQAAINFAAGASSGSIAVADFNGDGRADLIVTDVANAATIVLIGNGDGTFQPPASFAAGNNPSSVAIGDFNGDGKADAAVSNLADNTVSIFQGNGDGTFQAATAHATGIGPASTAISDMNGDGKPDLLVANTTDGTVSVFLGNGDGTFQSPTTYAAGVRPVFMTVADFNGDGKADLTIAGSTVNGNGMAAVLLGNGDGTLQAPLSYAVGSNPSSVLAGDFNGDGRADIAVADQGNSYVSVLLGEAPLTATTTALGSSQNPSNAGQSLTLTATVTPATATGTVSFLDGSTTLGTAIIGRGTAALGISSLSAGLHALTAIYSGDGADATSTSPLLAQTVNPTVSPTTTTLSAAPNPSTVGQLVSLTATVSSATATGTVTFFDGGTNIGSVPVTQGVASLSIAFSAGSHSLAASYSGDSLDAPSTSSAMTEVVNLPASTATSVMPSVNPSIYGQSTTVAVSVSPSSATGTVTLYDGTAMVGSKPLVTGQAAFSTALLPSGSGALRAYYGGGAADAASSSPSVAQIVNAAAATGFRSAVSYGSLVSPGAFAIGDMNGDGKADLVIANTGSANVAVLLGNGDGTFQTPVYLAPGTSSSAVAVGDFNGDGKSDIAVTTASGSIVIILGKGDGTFLAPVNYALSAAPFAIATADFNGDGKADIATVNTAANTVSVLLGDGDGTFKTALTYGAGAMPYSVVVGDFNGDGKPDLATASRSASSVNVLLGNGDGTFHTAVAYSVGGPAESIVAGDLNGDGKADLATANQGGKSASVLLGNGDGTFAAAVNYSIGSGSAYAITLGDFNGDGKLDLAVADEIQNTIDILSGKGDGTFQAAGSYAVGNGPECVASGEFNGDGRTDLVTANVTGGSISILLGASYSTTTTNLISSLNPSMLGQSVSLSATVAPVIATGSVTFLSGSNKIGTGALRNGIATLDTGALAAGLHSLTAVYGGDANDGASTSAVLTQTVNRDATAITLTSSANPSTFGQSVTLLANVSPASATGTVTFKKGLATLGTATLNGGAASLTVSTLTQGSHSLTVSYGGNAVDAPSNSAVLTQTVKKTSTTTTLSSSVNPSIVGQTVTFSASLSPSTATGTVTFYAGSKALGSSPIVGGTAIFSTSNLTAGSRSITAVYGGDANDSSSASSALTQTVKP